MRTADLPAVGALADRIHVEHPEDPEVFAERLKLFPEGCLALAKGSDVLGYTLAHPGRIGAPPPLNSLLGALPDAPDCLYLHDIALSPEVGRQGHGSAALERLIDVAERHGLATIALIAVRGSQPFWRRLGFRRVEDDALRAKLASYGADAVYMLRPTEAEMPDGL